MILLLSREIQQSFRKFLDSPHPAALNAIQYINENLGQKLTLDDIARNVM